MSDYFYFFLTALTDIRPVPASAEVCWRNIDRDGVAEIKRFVAGGVAVQKKPLVVEVDSEEFTLVDK